MYSSTLIFLPLLLASYVSAHGFVFSVTVNGKTDTGLKPGGSRQGSSAIRQVSSPNPNYGLNNPALTCGPNSRRAAETLKVMPGDTLQFDWRGADGSNWPHNIGPSITYLADCGGPCTDFDASNARWFKIDQLGKKQNSQEWFQNDLMSGGKAPAKLPENLAPGNYLIRHEIIALHIATTPPTDSQGAEFYPSCTQIEVGGSGTGRPLASELVSFPGAYSGERNKGIFEPDVFSNSKYNFPGPAIASFVNDPAASSGGNNGNSGNNDNNGGGNGGAANNAPSSTKSTSQPKSTGTSTTTTTGSSTKGKNVCKLKKSSSAKVARSTGHADVYPRSFSRVMRRFVDSGRFQRQVVPGSH